MQKIGREWWLASCLLAMIVGSVFPSKSFAATCTVGDFSQGYWKRIANPTECTIPGPPAADSPWPINAQGMPDPQGMGSHTYRIEGKYKLTVAMGGDGFRLTIPPPRPECISGLAEAYTVAASINYQRGCPESGCGRCEFVAQGTLLTMHSWDCNGYNHYQYVRFFDVPIMLEEWVWTKKDCANEPPPAPTNTPNPDPGAPTCPQVPLN